MEKIKSLFAANKRIQTLSFLFVIVFYVVIEALLKTGNLKSLIASMLVPVSCYVIVALALNLVVGVSGELSLGHAGFMSIGAFTGVIVAGYLSNIIQQPMVCFAIAVVFGAIVAGFFGFLISIPVLKLEGDYLAIVTLAFGQIIKTLINNIYLGVDNLGFHFSFVKKNFELQSGGKMFISGPVGATGTTTISNFTCGVIMILLTLVIIFCFINSRYGRAVMATRDDKIAAQSMGINIVKTKTIAFVLSAALAGAAGVLYGLNFTTLVPSKFDFNTSILILVYVVLGGLGNMLGTLISTVTLVMLPQLLRFLSDYRMLIYAILLIAIMILTNNPKVKEMIQVYVYKKKQKGETE
ncbi:MAG: branched-chain amino acid ABC transporter permease [Bacillota bacterium]|nr:branched-chain amino acid ABC transporter permease [Bacillota bacterium]